MTNNAKYITLNEDNFENEVLKGTEPVLVDFWASWCGPCRVIAPVIEELAADFDGRAKVGKVNVDDNAHVAAQYGIRSIPTLLFFKNGQVVDQVVGAVPKRVLADKLNALLQPAQGEERISSDSHAQVLATPLRQKATSLAHSIRSAVTSAINVGCRLIGG